jgi:O-antigen ligase
MGSFVAAGPALCALTMLVWTRSDATMALAFASLPLIAFCAALLVQAQRTALLAAVLFLPMSGIPGSQSPLPIPGAAVFPQDVILLLALGAWAFERLIFGRHRRLESAARTLPVGWPFVLFSLAIITAALRGHYEYGAALFGQPLRLVLYAAIGVTLVRMTTDTVYTVIRTVLYAGTLVTMLWAAYYIATGSSQTTPDLSTGGTRILAISTSVYCACTLFFALLSIQLTPTGSTRMLHLGMAVLSLFGVVLGFGRAVFAATALVCLVLLFLSKAVRGAVFSVVPLALPFLLLIGIMIPKLTPELVDAAKARVSSSPTADANVQWRLEASKAVFEQVREQPLFGVGFGRSTEFYLPTLSSSGYWVPVRIETDQDPHNSFLYLWAGGGLAALGSFLVLLGAAGYDGIRRYRSTVDPTSRVLLVWVAASLFTFMLNAATEPTFTSPSDLLTIWLLLVLPAVVPRRSRTAVTATQPRHSGPPGIRRLRAIG